MTMKRTLKGFTLIELMVTIAIASILLVVAVPNFTAYRRNAEVTSLTNTFLAALSAARGEAMKRGMNAFVVPTGNSTNWNAGWVVFVDKDRSNSLSSGGADIIVLTQPSVPAGISVTGNNSAGSSGSGTLPSYIMYDASGFSKTTTGGISNLKLTITRTDVTGIELLSSTRKVVIDVTGRARTCKPESSTDANC